MTCSFPKRTGCGRRHVRRRPLSEEGLEAGSLRRGRPQRLVTERAVSAPRLHETPIPSQTVPKGRLRTLWMEGTADPTGAMVTHQQRGSPQVSCPPAGRSASFSQRSTGLPGMTLDEGRPRRQPGGSGRLWRPFRGGSCTHVPKEPCCSGMPSDGHRAPLPARGAFQFLQGKASLGDRPHRRH